MGEQRLAIPADATLLELPAECRQHMMTFLNVHDLLVLSKTSVQMQSEVRSHVARYRWSEVEIDLAELGPFGIELGLTSLIEILELSRGVHFFFGSVDLYLPENVFPLLNRLKKIIMQSDFQIEVLSHHAIFNLLAVRQRDMGDVVCKLMKNSERVLKRVIDIVFWDDRLLKARYEALEDIHLADFTLDPLHFKKRIRHFITLAPALKRFQVTAHSYHPQFTPICQEFQCNLVRKEGSTKYAFYFVKNGLGTRESLIPSVLYHS